MVVKLGWEVWYPKISYLRTPPDTRRIKLQEKPKRTMKFSDVPIFYDLFSNYAEDKDKKGLYSLKLINNNSKSGYFPVLNLAEVYKTDDLDFFRKGFFVSKLLKRNCLWLVYTPEESYLAKIPYHLILEHISYYTLLKPAVLGRLLSDSYIKLLLRIGPRCSEVNLKKPHPPLPKI